MIVLKATQDKVLAVLQSVAGIVERRNRSRDALLLLASFGGLLWALFTSFWLRPPSSITAGRGI